MPRSTKRLPVAAAFGARVRKLREEQGWSQMSFADEAGMHFTMISSVERGERNVSLVTIVRLAQGLKVDPGILVEGLQV